MTAELDAKNGIDNIVKIKPLASQKDIRCRGCGNVGISRIKRGAFVRTLFFGCHLSIMFAIAVVAKPTGLIDQAGNAGI